MIIDFHTHIFPDHVAANAIAKLIESSKNHSKLSVYTDGTYNGLLKSMESASIDYSVVMPIATDPKHGAGILKWIQSYINLSNKIIFFSSIHPEDTEFKERINAAHNIGIKGLKFHPDFQGFAVDDERVFKLYEEAIKNDLILFFHAGFDPSFVGSDKAIPKRFSNFAKKFPEAKIVLAHSGGYRNWAEVYKELSDTQVYFDTAFVLDFIFIEKDQDLLKLFHEKKDYFLFGTDSPWKEQKTEVQLIKECGLLSSVEIDDLLYKNAKKLLNLK